MSENDSTTPIKRCRACDGLYPATPRYFHKHAAGRYGLDPRCKACCAKPENRGLILAKMLCPHGMKVCTACVTPKGLHQFRRNSQAPDGLNARCKPCHTEQQRPYKESEQARKTKRRYGVAYRARDREGHLRRCKEWREARRDEINSRNRERWASDPEWRRQREEWAREQYQANRDARIAYAREYRDANPDKPREWNRNRRARESEAEGSYTLSEVRMMLESQDGLCAYCEEPLGTDFHVDHMTPLSRGGRNDWTNLAISCGFCNLSKHAKTAEEFMEERAA